MKRNIILTCTWVCMGLDASTCSESLPERTCDFNPPEHVPRTSARAQTCVRAPGGLPACHGAESTRKDPRPEENKVPKGRKKQGYVRIEIRSAERIFFFQAEDGIRDCLLSRGLGDVYKRQILGDGNVIPCHLILNICSLSRATKSKSDSSLTV